MLAPKDSAFPFHKVGVRGCRTPLHSTVGDWSPPWSSLLPTAWTLSAEDVAEPSPDAGPRMLGVGWGPEQRARGCSL